MSQSWKIAFAGPLVVLLFSAASYGQDGSAATVESGWTPRPGPLRQLETSAVIEAVGFGIRPDTGENVAPALRKLTDHLATLTEPTTVTFEKGVYHVSGGRAAFDLNGLSNLVIDGRGAEFIIQSPGTDFTRSTNCRTIIFRNLVVDADPLPFTQGTIVGVDPQRGTFDLNIDPGYQGLGEYNLSHTGPLSRRWGMLKDPNIPGRLKRGVPNYYNVELSAEDLGARTYRLRLMNRSQINAFQVGDRYVQLIDGPTPRNFMNRSSDITYENITMFCAGASYVGVRNKNISILGCRTMLRDDRLASSTADGILLQAGENGPWVENCVFEGISDDGMNVYQHPLWVKQVIADRRLLLTPSNTPFDVDDTLTFFDPVEGTILARLRVLSRTNTKQGVETVFDGDLPAGLRVGSARVLGGGAKGKTFEGAGMSSTQVYNEKYLSGSAVVRNCVFKNSRNVAFKLQSHNVIIENTVIEGWDGYGIFAANLVNYPEGFLGNHFVFRNNLIKDCGFRGSRPGIYFGCQTLGYKPSASADMGNMVITENLIINPGGWGIQGASFNEVEIKGNTIVFSDGVRRPGAISLNNTAGSSCCNNRVVVIGNQESAAGINLDPNVKNEGNVVRTDRDAAADEVERQWRARQR